MTNSSCLKRPASSLNEDTEEAQPIEDAPEKDSSIIVPYTKEESTDKLKEFGIQLGGNLQEKIKSYAKAMVSQNVDDLKHINLKAAFTDSEMSTLWGRLKQLSARHHQHARQSPMNCVE